MEIEFDFQGTLGRVASSLASRRKAVKPVLCVNANFTQKIEK